ncbi:hypothetical protein GTP55_24760 [Duganella sp. FT109W]|uniref:Uncharacterized protein n=1 Tax=Duganella margarita TaxID=2692170 RepID=A0ABW9WMV1_9BURK|nr:hypothetical protein [Duganella margarita]MYN42556.1 hypothetical protein [Duganella margarita]
MDTGGKEAPFNRHQRGQLGDRAWEEQRGGGGGLLSMLGTAMPTELAPDFFRHRRRTAASIPLALQHVGADLLLGRLQTGWHARTPLWKMANNILTCDDLFDAHQTSHLMSLTQKCHNKISTD